MNDPKYDLSAYEESVWDIECEAEGHGDKNSEYQMFHSTKGAEWYVVMKCPKCTFRKAIPVCSGFKISLDMMATENTLLGCVSCQFGVGSVLPHHLFYGDFVKIRGN